MNNILVVTADLKRCSVALAYDNKIFSKTENLDSATHLVSLVRSVVNSANADLQKINSLITTSGPGSFTGIRVAQSVIKGLALSLNIPAKCLSYFEVIKNVYGKNEDIVALIKSEKQQVYFYDFAARTCGVSSYQELKSQVTPHIPWVGEKIEKLQSICDGNYVEISDFRDAKNLLSLTDIADDQVCPLYIGMRNGEAKVNCW